MLIIDLASGVPELPSLSVVPLLFVTTIRFKLFYIAPRVTLALLYVPRLLLINTSDGKNRIIVFSLSLAA